jgi:hypothetical protein
MGMVWYGACGLWWFVNQETTSVSSRMVCAGTVSLAQSVSKREGQCVWQGTQEIQGNSSLTMAQHFFITAHVSVTIITTFVHPIA